MAVSPIILVGPEDPGRLPAIAEELAPRLDYRLVAERCRGEVRQWLPSPAGFSGPRVIRLGRSFGGNLSCALRLVRVLPRGSIVYSTGETWGLPVALAGAMLHKRGFVHVVYVHRVFSPAWLGFIRRAGRLLAVDGWICVTRYQAQLLRQAIGPSGAQVTNVSQGVDTAFFDPRKARDDFHQGYLLSVGAEMRDYRLLMDAVRGLDVEVVVKASSAWMTGGRSELRRIPPNVKIITRRMSYVELRNLYAGASLVAAPLYDTPQAAGITTILEAMAMRKCVVATRSKGLPDVLVHGLTGIVVEADVRGLSHAIWELSADTAKRISLANASRSTVSKYASLEAHARQVADVLAAAKQEDD